MDTVESRTLIIKQELIQARIILYHNSHAE